jgi:hypothetical protein
MLLALNPPPIPPDSPSWLHLLFPFWSIEGNKNSIGGWLYGWQVAPAIILWHHVTMLMRPGGMNWWRSIRIALGYIIAIMAIWVLARRPHLFAEISGDPLFLSTIKPGPLYYPFLLFIFLFTIFSLINIFRSARTAPSSMPRRQLTILGIATITAGLTAPATLISVASHTPLPQISVSILLTIAVILIGFGVARYSALIEGRTIRRDFYYNAISMSLVTLIYSIVTWISVAIFDIPPAAFVFVIILAIVTHNLVDTTRRALDSIFYRQENRELRANLRKLASEIGEQDMEENIALAFEGICDSIRATFGVIILFENKKLKTLASYKFKRDNLAQPIRDFTFDDVVHVEPGQFAEPLEKAVLMVPLYVDTNQIGVVVFGRPVNSMNYSKDDIERILYPSDRLADAIHNVQREAEYLRQLSKLTTPEKTQQHIPIKDVENALRNLYDYALLGDTIFKKFNLVRSRLSADDITHVDRGKAVYQVMVEAIEKLRPETEPTRDPPPREWHPYFILHDAYLEEKMNRDIMSQLYISEGTFNRTRRRAIRSVARILGELEAAIH